MADVWVKAFVDTAAPFLASFAAPKASASTGLVPTAAAPLAAAMNPAAPVAALSAVGLQLLLEPTGGLIFRGACNTAAIVYPVYRSFKAIESKEKEDDVQWLTYWTIYGSMIFLEHMGDSVLRKVPYYYHAKFALLLWLQLPHSQGATYLYNRFYKPLLSKYQDKIDTILEKLHAALVYLYEANKMPISVALSVLAAIKEQATKFATWFTSEEGKGGPKAAAA